MCVIIIMECIKLQIDPHAPFINRFDLQIRFESR